MSALRKVRIGIGAPLSGSAAPIGKEIKQAVELAIDSANQHGEIEGVVIEVVCGDDAGDLHTATSLARTFCSDDALLAVIGHHDSDVTLACASIYEQHGLLMVTPSASSPVLTERGFTCIFRYTHRDDLTAASLAEYLFDVLGKRRAVIVEGAAMHGATLSRELVGAFRAFGGEVMSQPVTCACEEGAAAAAMAALPAESDMVFFDGSVEGASALQILRAQGRTELFVAGEACFDQRSFLEPAGRSAMAREGVLIVSASPEIGRVPGSHEFAARYAAHYGQIGQYAANAYDCARAVIAAIAVACRDFAYAPQRADAVAAMRELKLRGVAYRAPLEWDLNGDNIAASAALHVVREGAFEQIAELAGPARMTAAARPSQSAYFTLQP